MRNLRRELSVGLAALLGLLAAGLAGNAPFAAIHASSSPLTVDIFVPFSGPDGIFGPFTGAGCYPAVRVINQAGGVLGHSLTCQGTDTKGDPADAVPAARRMLATTGGLVGILGPSSDEGAATIPIFEQAGVPFFTSSGQAAFDHVTNPYFYRLFPPDDAAGYAMALWAHRRHFTRAAAVFGSDPASQGTVPTLVKAFTKGGGRITINESIALDQTSYRSEIERLLVTHPQVIFTEVDPQTAATYFSELQQLKGSLLPIIGADPTLTPQWFSAVSSAIGTSNLLHYEVAEQPATPPSKGTAWRLWNKALFASKKQVAKPAQYASNFTPEVEYDSVNILALAMVAAHSTSPKNFNRFISQVTVPRKGAVRVATFSAGLAALRNGHEVQYIGVSGPFLLNKWHDAPNNFEIDHFDKKGNLVTIAHVTPQQIASVAN